MSCVYCNIWFLDATFPNRWIGRDDPTPWPPRSPDITPRDFCLWWYVKDKSVFDTSSRYYKCEGKSNVRFCYNNCQDMLENTWREIDCRLDVLRATKGAHVEVY